MIKCLCIFVLGGQSRLPVNLSLAQNKRFE